MIETHTCSAPTPWLHPYLALVTQQALAAILGKGTGVERHWVHKEQRASATPLSKEVSAEVPRKPLKWGPQKDKQARNADMHPSTAGPGGLSLWLQLPPETVGHWLYPSLPLGGWLPPGGLQEEPCNCLKDHPLGSVWSRTPRLLQARPCDECCGTVERKKKYTVWSLIPAPTHWLKQKNVKYRGNDKIEHRWVWHVVFDLTT